ncbi:MAG: four helix bundle protein [Pyrinomonadaceae bacterium]
MAKIERFEDIESWKLARQVTRRVYEVSSSGEFVRDFALKDQMRRAAISISSNIAEGFERGGDKEFIQFLSIAKGSCGELKSQLYVAFDQSYIDTESFDSTYEQLTETSKLISGLMKYLQQSDMKGSKYK